MATIEPKDLLKAGWQVQCERLAFTHRLMVTDGYTVEILWCYHSRDAAAKAWAAWHAVSYEGEPDGWHRAKRAGQPFRRRPDGDATREYRDDDAAAVAAHIAFTL